MNDTAQGACSTTGLLRAIFPTMGITAFRGHARKPSIPPFRIVFVRFAARRTRAVTDPCRGQFRVPHSQAYTFLVPPFAAKVGHFTHTQKKPRPCAAHLHFLFALARQRFVSFPSHFCTSSYRLYTARHALQSQLSRYYIMIYIHPSGAS